MTSEIREEDWQKIFSSYVDTTEDMVTIHTDSIKEIARKDLRLMTKFDTYESQPQVFKENGYFLLPLQNRGDFALIRGNGFQELEKIEASPKKWVNRLGAALRPGRSEAKYINVAYLSGMLEDFLGIKGLKMLQTGRKYTSPFSFYVGNVGPINVDSVQIQVDGEFINKKLVLLEAKVGQFDNFNKRQLFYPYRYWDIQLEDKEITSLFFVYDTKNEQFNFWQFAIEDKEQYNSFHVEKKASYTAISPTKETTIQDAERAGQKAGAVEQTWDVPQADDFEKVSTFPFAVEEGFNTSKKIAKFFDFEVRQSNYYRQAAEIIGLVKVDTKTHTYELTSAGKKYVNSNAFDRNMLLSGLLFKLPFVQEIVRIIEGEGDISFDEIARIIEKNSDLGTRTSKRRTRTIKKWFEWIESNLGIVRVGNKNIYDISRYSTLN